MLRKSSLLLTSFAILIAVSTASDCPFWDDEAADPLRVIAVKEVLASKGKHYAILDLAKGPASLPREIKSQYLQEESHGPAPRQAHPKMPGRSDGGVQVVGDLV